jgi:uncharacterized membrane-anchored protein YhcB (DUF1043 family)
LRIAQVLGVGTFIWVVFLLTGFQSDDWQGILYTWVQNVLITFLTWESLEYSILRLEWLLPWRQRPVLRFVTQAVWVPTVSSLTIGIPMLIFSWLYNGEIEINTGFRIMLVIGILISLLISTIFSAMDFYRQSLQSAIEVEQLQEEGLKSQLETLRQQVNPHFLFNSLNVLSALIPLDSDRAQIFVHQMSKVYRYVLDAGKSEFVEIQEELDFLEAYGFLLQQRFGNALSWDIQQEAGLKGKVPSLALQLLAENAVKHNVVSISKPLTIQVIAGSGTVRVLNNLQKKNVTEPSTEIGLNNIVQRYLLSGYSLPEIIQSERSFEVVLPLI